MIVFSYFIPVCVLLTIIYASFKKVKIYDSFARGIKKAINLVIDIFPYICAIIIMTKLLEISGVNKTIINLFTPLMRFFGIPTEIIPLIILKPFSGGGSLALLSDLIQTHGADSYIARTASVVYASGETIFYVGAVYFSKCKNKKIALPILIALISSFISIVFASLICKFI